MTALRTLTRAIGSAIALAAILLGAPLVLWTLGRPMLPATLPSSNQVVDALTRPDDGRLLLGALVVVGALAWALLAFSILAEVVSVITRRPVWRIDLPGFRGSRALATTLIAAILSLGATPAMAQPAVAATTSWVAPPLRSSNVHAAPPRVAAQPGPLYVVAARDTLWGIAERELGDPLRWREIYDLNVGRPQPDGTALTEASLLTVGWRLQLPATVIRPEQIRVVAGDTLSDIADEHLGSVNRTTALFDTNRGRPQSDGTALRDPDLLKPGWILTLPAPDGPIPAPPVRSTTPDTSGRATSAPASPVPRLVPADPRPPDAPSPRPPTSTSSPAPRTTAPPTPRLTPNAGANDAAPAAGQPSAVMPITLAASSLLISGMIGALVIRRRRQLRARPAGHRIAVPSNDAGRFEWIGSQDREPDVADQLDIAFLDAALRTLSVADWTGIDTPPLRSIMFSPSAAVLTLAHRTSLPAPFIAVGDAESDDWILSPGAVLPVEVDEAHGYCAPFPLLVSVATSPTPVTAPPGGRSETELLLDLEQLGHCCVTGDTDRAHGLLRHITAELANAPWAEDVEILTVGLGDELTAFNPDRIRALPDLDSGLSAVQIHLRAARANIERLPVRSVLDGRLRDVASDSWLPIILISAVEPSAEQRVTLRRLTAELTGRERMAAAVVTPGEGPGYALHVDSTGQLTTADVTDGPWQVATLEAQTSSTLASLFDATSRPPVQVGPVTNHAAWAANMREDGSIDLTAIEQGVTGLADTQPADDPDDLDAEAHDHYVDAGEDDTEEVLTEVAAVDDDPGDAAPIPAPVVDPEAERRLEIVVHQDPDLDEDLQRWWSEDPPTVPLIAILGQPTVRAPGTLPTTRLSWFVEILVYLSLHPSGVTPSKAETDLWSDGQRKSISTIRHAFYGARRWAGRGLDGDPERAFVSDMQNDNTYRLRGHLLDWDLFRRLRKRAQARHAAGHPGAVEDYRAALDLVRAPVLSSLRSAGYAWLNNHDQRHDLHIPGFIVDTAHEFVDIALAAGDTTLARTAAEVGRAVDIDVIFDRPLTDLMRIAHAEDSQSEMERYAAALLYARGFEVPEELSPDTFAVLNELLPAGPRRRP